MVAHSLTLLPSGRGFLGETWAGDSTTDGWDIHLAGDFSGDGKDDVAGFHPSNGTRWVSLSTGSDFVTTRWSE